MLLRFGHVMPIGRSNAFVSKSLTTIARSTQKITAILLGLSFAFGMPAFAVGLAEIETRSYLGEPLNLRIAVNAAANEPLDASCFSLGSSADSNTEKDSATSSIPLITRRETRLTLVEIGNARYLQLRGQLGFNEPLARLLVRVGCQAEAGVTREYAVLLDPSPLIAASVTDSVAAVVAGPVVSQRLNNELGAPLISAYSAGQWKVYAGRKVVSVASIATGIFPKSRARRADYIAALRELNPALSGTADDAPLPDETILKLPDLKALSASSVVRKSQVRTVASRQSAAMQPARQATDITPASIPPQSARIRSSPDQNVASIKNVPRSSASKSLPKTTAGAFQLRLSGSEMDLSRSQGMTEAMRAEIREKQLLLDADDQVAQLLSLKNTVKQLEGRLNAMQSKLQDAAVASNTPIANANGPPTTLPETSTSLFTERTEPNKPVTKTAQAADTAKTTSINAASLKSTRWHDSTFLGVSIGWLTGLLLSSVALIGIVISARLLYRRSHEKRLASVHDLNSLNEANISSADDSLFFDPSAEHGIGNGFDPFTSRHAVANAGHDGVGNTDTTNPRDADKAVDEFARANHLRDEAMLKAIKQQRTVQMQSHPDSATGPGHETTPATPRFDTTMPPALSLLADLSADDEIARFDLDTAPATAVDFLIGSDDPGNDAHIRRLQYMFERYPELSSKTISIDDADSVINAARLYYEEAETESARDKACELLTFGIEERPQEIRFWLAQFEIYRLDNLAKEFTELSAKFHVLFGHTDSWPKVRQLGYGLDPTNPLFAAAGNASLAVDRFDPLTENWLMAPIDSSAGILISEMRQSLFKDHGVGTLELEKITSALTALHDSAALSAKDNTAG